MIPDVNKDAAGILKNIECFALDMDGTIYLGEQWIEGAREFLSAVEAAGKRYVFLTNNSSKNPQVYVKKLSRMGQQFCSIMKTEIHCPIMHTQKR